MVHEMFKSLPREKYLENIRKRILERQREIRKQYNDNEIKLNNIENELYNYTNN